MQAISDYLDIRDLAARYNRCADLGDKANYVLLFTEDAEFDLVGNRVYRGRAEIAEVCAASAVTVHITTDPSIEVDGDSATQRSRLITCFRAQDRSRNDFIATGWYTDELRRTDSGWLFFRRRCDLDLDVNEVFQKMSITAAFQELVD